jgi:hypothetical protein
MNQKKHYDEVESIADLIGIKLAPIEQVLACYPDEFLGMEFDDEEESGASKARKEYSSEFQKKLIKAFRSHDWLVYSDIYGHNGLSSGGSCKSCGRKFKFPEPDIDPPEEKSEDKQNWRRKFRSVSDNFILAYHYIYGQHKRFGGRITKCKGKE